MSDIVNPVPAALSYGQGALDRASDRRQNAEWIRDLLHSRSSRFLPNWRYRHAVREHDEGPRAVIMEQPSAVDLLSESSLTIFLGLNESSAIFALDLEADDESELADRIEGQFLDLRRVGPSLAADEASVLAYARGMIYWHRHHGFCGRCGRPTTLEHGGHLRRCSSADCGKETFPRTDPAVIMLVEHVPEDDGPRRCLLGRGPKWPAGTFSTLAGFVEPGESLEQAVAREVLEEAGVAVDQITYRGSQPWPFPSSLMLGFRARSRATELRLDPDELADAGWFTAQELSAFGEWGDRDAQLKLPRRDSIARFLVDQWIAEQG